jgi:hypothetical protein
MTKIESVGYMIQDIQGNAIFGVGATVDEAWADVMSGIHEFHNNFGETIDADEAFETQFKVFGATQALIDEVNANGGDISWAVVGGVGCTRGEEEDAAQ